MRAEMLDTAHEGARRARANKEIVEARETMVDGRRRPSSVGFDIGRIGVLVGPDVIRIVGEKLFDVLNAAPR